MKICVSVYQKCRKPLKIKDFFLIQIKKLCVSMCIICIRCVSAPEVHPLSFCGSRINLYTVNIQYTNRPLKAFIYKEKYGKISIEK